MEKTGSNHDFIGYDYLECRTNTVYRSLYLDGYKNLGWITDENYNQSKAVMRLKRDRKIANKPELIRLQSHFEACMKDLAALEKVKSSSATMVAIIGGAVGTVFLAGAVFAVTAEPPIIWLTMLLGIPGLAGWILPAPIYRLLVKRDAKKVAPLIDAKYDEVYEICKKANNLL